MLTSATTLSSYRLVCFDGDIGPIQDFYFDDQHWTIRYLAAAGKWLPGRQVLIAPYAVSRIVSNDQSIIVDLTKAQIEQSPSLAADKPISHQFEEDYYAYHGWPLYWSGPFAWGYYRQLIRNREKWTDLSEQKRAWEPHLYNIQRLSGLQLKGSDGEIGRVEDSIIEESTWSIRYLVVKTGDWCAGRKILLSPKWFERMSLSQSKIDVPLNRGTVKHSPEFSEEFLILREYENQLHDHYKKPGYWRDDPAHAEEQANSSRGGLKPNFSDFDHNASYSKWHNQ